MTKKETEERKKEDLLRDEHGPEKMMWKCHAGRVDLPLSKLSKSLSVFTPFSNEKVKGVKQSILDHFEPSLVRFLVCIKDPNNFNRSDLDSNEYEVIGGRHLLIALKELDREGHLTKLKTIAHKRVTCFVLSTKSSFLKTYTGLRLKEIESKWADENSVEMLLGIHLGLKSEVGEVESKSAVMKYADLLDGVKVEDKACLQRVLSWPEAPFKSAVDAVSAFKTYETLDCRTNLTRIESKLKAGKMFPMKKSLFRSFSRLDPNLFHKYIHNVLEKKVSLEEFVSNFIKVINRSQVVELASQIYGDSVFAQHKENFENDVLDSFVGAKIGEKSNPRGKALTEYCSALKNKGSAIPTIRLRNQESLEGISQHELEEFNMIIFNLGSGCSSLLPKLEAFKRAKPRRNILLVFHDFDNCVQYYQQMKTGENASLFEPKILFFEKILPAVKDGICSNALYAVFSGTMHARTLNVLNSQTSPLHAVVKQIAQPYSQIGFFNEGLLDIILVHNEKLFVTYAGNVKCLERIPKDSLFTPMSGEENLEDENIAEKSVTERISTEGLGTAEDEATERERMGEISKSPIEGESFQSSQSSDMSPNLLAAPNTIRSRKSIGNLDFLASLDKIAEGVSNNVSEDSWSISGDSGFTSSHSKESFVIKRKESAIRNSSSKRKDHSPAAEKSPAKRQEKLTAYFSQGSTSRQGVQEMEENSILNSSDITIAAASNGEVPEDCSFSDENRSDHEIADSPEKSTKKSPMKPPEYELEPKKVIASSSNELKKSNASVTEDIDPSPDMFEQSTFFSQCEARPIQDEILSFSVDNDVPQSSPIKYCNPIDKNKHTL